MLTIGTFARLRGVSVRTLHHYEKVELLAPANVDVDTGYRGYQAAQLPRLHRIVALKELGLTLAQIRPLLDDLGAGQLAEMLLAKRTELESEVADRQLQLARVEHRLKHIELENDMTIDIVLKHVPALRVAQIRGTSDQQTDFYGVADFVRPAYEALSNWLEASSVSPSGSPFVHYVEVDETQLIPTLAIPIDAQPLDPTSDIDVATLDGATVASTVFEGPPDHDSIGPLYSRLVQFATDNGFQPRGPGRDVLVGATDDGMILELQLPLEAI